jgi:hypothetical protein
LAEDKACYQVHKTVTGLVVGSIAAEVVMPSAFWVVTLVEYHV